MSAISAILLVGLSTLSPVDLFRQSCSEVPAKQDFEPYSFFKGIWYVTHSLPPENGVCISIKSQMSGRLVREIYTFAWTDATEYAEGYIYIGSFKKPGKFLSQTRPIRTRPIADFIPVNKTVIETDYENYAIVYNCIQIYDHDGGPSVFHVLSRNPNPEQVHPNVDRELRRLQMKLSNFGSTKVLHCPRVDQFMKALIVK